MQPIKPEHCDVPEILETERGPQIIYQRLVNTGRHWQPLFVKLKEKKNQGTIVKDLEELESSFRLYFFSTDGIGFIREELMSPWPSVGHPVMVLWQLLDQVRPTKENENQSYLKLIVRISLVIVHLDQVRYHDLDIASDDGKEPMNDGAGRISPTLAWKIIQCLDLKARVSPAAFQARFGGAKGMWVINYNEKSGLDWLDVYPSQQKWARNEGNWLEINDTSHRTYSANLPAMGLYLQRQLSRPSQPGSISYLGSMPVTLEERLNVMLDAGFAPTESIFMGTMAKDLFKRYCDNLKSKLNIRVGNSAYAYMIPDFWGVLAPDEVYIDFSSFGSSELSPKVVLDGVDILVARTPAHYASDIQKVKAVRKLELIDLKDVIIFPTRGDQSLASKLSGGDSEGDEAWIC
ncbi:RNA dependent RNA polymerase-domain-containing protein [Rhexocercosporidium sp. MPI-PUGE-AT-0058]|nr:RNA dependent RNA polymerase-domain-containing protein [Rhexocercosporidium sp. MPI-PUGE-AT-0058]